MFAIELSKRIGSVAILGLACGTINAQPALPGQKITIATFGGSAQQSYRDGWVEPFERATGAKAVLDAPNSKAKLKAMVESGNPSWDVYTGDAAYILANCGVLFEKVDTSRFVAAGIDKRFVNNECGVPTAVIPFVFAYNEEKYAANPPRRWADFFDLKKYPGKRAIYNSPTTGILEMALLADGVPEDKLYPLDVNRALMKLDTIKSSIMWTQSTGGLTDAFVNKQADLALSSGGRTLLAAKAGAKVAVVADQQIMTWDQFAVVKGSKERPAAEAFLHFIAQQPQQEKLTELLGAGNASVKSRPKIDPLVSRYLPQTQSGVSINQEWWSKNFAEVSQQFITWQSK